MTDPMADQVTNEFQRIRNVHVFRLGDVNIGALYIESADAGPILILGYSRESLFKTIGGLFENFEDAQNEQLEDIRTKIAIADLPLDSESESAVVYGEVAIDYWVIISAKDYFTDNLVLFTEFLESKNQKFRGLLRGNSNCLVFSKIQEDCGIVIVYSLQQAKGFIFNEENHYLSDSFGNLPQLAEESENPPTVLTGDLARILAIFEMGFKLRSDAERISQTFGSLNRQSYSGRSSNPSAKNEHLN